MIRRLAAAALLLALSACASGPQRGDRTARGFNAIANPSAIVATELRFASTARREGQWSAYRDFMADGALLFIPRLVGAETWLDNRPDPGAVIDWQPHHIYIGCDGALAASVGAWQGDDMTHGAYLTVWQRQLDGSYRWLLDYDWPRELRLGEPEFVTTDIIGCPDSEAFGATAVPGSVTSGGKGYEEGELVNGVRLALTGERALSVSIHVDGREEANLTFLGLPSDPDRRQGRVTIVDNGKDAETGEEESE